MIITTTHNVHGYKIQKYLGIVSGEAVAGIFFVKDMFASLHDAWGGRAKSYEKELIKAVREAVTVMVERAQSLSANAVIGVQCDVEVMSPRGKGTMLMVVVMGTAVSVEGDRDVNSQ